MTKAEPHTESVTSKVLQAGINPSVNVPEGAIKSPGGGTKAMLLVKVARTDSKSKYRPAQQKKAKNSRKVQSSYRQSASCNQR